MTNALSPVKEFPGPPSNWLWGNLAEFRRGQLSFYETCRREYGPLVPFRLGRHRFLLVCEPSAIEQILVTKNRDFRKHYVLRILVPVLGQGLLTSEGDLWLQRRRLVQPAFARTHLARYAESMTKHAREVSVNWVAGVARNVHRDFTQMTLRIAAETILGVTLREECDQIGASLETIQHDFTERFNSLWPLPSWLPTPRNQRRKKAVGQLESLIARLVEERCAATTNSIDALSALLEQFPPQAGQGLPSPLRDEILTLFLAGHDTTSNALSWTFCLLAQHPRVEEQLFAEINAVVGVGTPAFEHVPQLRWCRQLVQESLRLYPPAYAFGREAVRDTSVGGFALRRGDNVIIPQWVVHRDPRYFTNPLEFAPERWTDAFTAGLPPYAYFPFGGGPRVCIGNQFAMLELVLIVATLAQKFRLRLDPVHSVVTEAAATLRPQGGMWMLTDPR